MPSKIYITTPLDFNILNNLKAGDLVYLSGTIYTARDSAHQKITESIIRNDKLPFDFKGAVIYYAGPAPEKPGSIIGSIGPTTSMRMDSYTELLLKNGIKGMIGKGERSNYVSELLKKEKAVYFTQTGGIAALLSKLVTESKIIAYPELGAESVRMLRVENFPLIVANDIFGGSVFQNAQKYRLF